MKKLWCVAVFAALAGEADAGRILFIGNSYTGVNRLGDIFRDIAVSGGQPTPLIEAVTPGGMTLAQHLKQPETLAQIDQGNWDVVILQGHSQEAARAESQAGSRAGFLKGAADLCRRIRAKSPMARIVFYETWARHADYWKDAKADTALGANPAEMQARIRKWYRRAAEENHGFIAPVGDAWELNYRNPRALRLHAMDHSHPAFTGSYLAGLVIFATVYQARPLNIRWRGKLDEAEAHYLQELAAQATAKAGLANKEM